MGRVVIWVNCEVFLCSNWGREGDLVFYSSGFSQGVDVLGQEEDPLSGPGGLALSPQDVALLGRQLVDEVGTRASQTIQNSTYTFVYNFGWGIFVILS